MQEGRGTGTLTRPAGRLGLWRQVIGYGAGARVSANCKGRHMIKTQIRLDVPPVEPKDRYERIMSAYESPATGETMELVVDHDPHCMYYTLRATRGDDAFKYLEGGPETWRVIVRRVTDAPEVS